MGKAGAVTSSRYAGLGIGTGQIDALKRRLPQPGHRRQAFVWGVEGNGSLLDDEFDI